MNRALPALAFLAAIALSGQSHAAEIFQLSTISRLATGHYDGSTTMTELLRHGDFGLGTFNGVDGEMIILDGKVYRGTADGRAHLVPANTRTPFAEITKFRAAATATIALGASIEQLQTALDALPGNPARILVARIDGRFQMMRLRSEPKQTPPYRPLADVIREQQVVHSYNNIAGTLVGFRYPSEASSVNVAGWHFHFLSADRTIGGHVLALTTETARAATEEIADLLIRVPEGATAATATEEDIKAIERPRQ